MGQQTLDGNRLQFAGTISGSGRLTYIAQNNWTETGPMETAFALNAASQRTDQPVAATQRRADRA